MKFCEILPLLLTLCTVVKTKGKISQNFVAFSEYMNFKNTEINKQSHVKYWFNRNKYGAVLINIMYGKSLMY